MYLEIIIDQINSNLPFVIRIIVAGILGSIIGLERDIHGRAAGLRTHLLVCIGSALFTIMSIKLSEYAMQRGYHNLPITDPARVAAQIVTGIGFIGAGAIIKEGFSIKGLTTAACLWVVAAIGMAAGIGNYILATSASFIAIISLIILNKFEKFYKKDSYRSLTITTPLEVDPSIVINTIKGKYIKILYYDCERDYVNKTITSKLSIRIFQKGITDKISHELVKKLENADIKLKYLKWDHLN